VSCSRSMAVGGRGLCEPPTAYPQLQHNCKSRWMAGIKYKNSVRYKELQYMRMVLISPRWKLQLLVSSFEET